MFKSGRGGRRPGAGRPAGSPNVEKKKKQKTPVTVRLPIWIADWLKGQDESQAKLIEMAVVEFYNLEKP